MTIDRPRRAREQSLQIACARWFDLQYPKLSMLLHHSPNGGWRNKIEAAKFKAMGTRAGFPDFILLVPTKDYPFLCIELKTDKGRQSDVQKEYQRAIENIGGLYVVVRNVDEFIATVRNYL